MDFLFQLALTVLPFLAFFLVQISIKKHELALVLCNLLDTIKLQVTNIRDPLSWTIEHITQTETDDVAAVRDADQGGALGYVAVLESAEDSLPRPKYFETIHATTSGETKEAVIYRGGNPVNEFIENGANIMRLFRSHFPLMKLAYTGETTESCTPSKDKKGGGKRAVSRPLQAKGTVTVTDMRHMFLQSSAEIAKELPLLFYLANQTQRHAVLRSTSVRVLYGQEKRFHAITNNMRSSKGLQTPLPTLTQQTPRNFSESAFKYSLQLDNQNLGLLTNGKR